MRWPRGRFGDGGAAYRPDMARHRRDDAISGNADDASSGAYHYLFGIIGGHDDDKHALIIFVMQLTRLSAAAT